MKTTRNSMKNRGDVQTTICSTRVGYLPDGIWLDEITVYARTEQVNRLAVMMIAAGYEVVEIRKNHDLDDTYAVGLFHRHDDSKFNPFFADTKPILIRKCVERGIDWQENLKKLDREQLNNLLLAQ